MEENLQAVISYMKSHWPSDIKDEWQVKLEEYPEILKKVLAKWTVNASKTNELVRIAGQSGSGKTTQLLPAVEAYFKNSNKSPILVAARRFVEFHPNMEEIKNEYGEENLRKKTDEFSTMMTVSLQHLHSNTRAGAIASTFASSSSMTLLHLNITSQSAKRCSG